jgi:hypothetical protein
LWSMTDGWLRAYPQAARRNNHRARRVTLGGRWRERK